jgi:hypothetical protein
VTTPSLAPSLLEALNTLLSFHTQQSAGGTLEVRWQMHVSEVDPENRRRYADAWRVVAAAAAEPSAQSAS